tara:strand:- start:233 stop:568 length:336 start_codon:yes stop_codon:yes gene_type:complete
MPEIRTFNRKFEGGWINVDHTDEDFPEVLEYLKNQYHHNGGDSEAETIINFAKPDTKLGYWSFYSTHSPISRMIKRCPKGILKLRYNSSGAELIMSVKDGRPEELIAKIHK